MAGLPAPLIAESRLDRLLRNRSTMGVWLTNSPSKLYYERTRISTAMQQLQQAPMVLSWSCLTTTSLPKRV